MSDDLSREIDLPQTISGLAELRSILARLPAPVSASTPDSRSGSTIPLTTDATSEMAAPLAPQAESLVVTNPTTLKFNMLADPAFDAFLSNNPDLTGTFANQTADWQAGYVLNSGALLSCSIQRAFSRGDVANPMNTALLRLYWASTGSACNIDVYLQPVNAHLPNQLPVGDFLVAMVSAFRADNLATDPDFTVVTASLQIVQDPDTSPVVVDESPLFDYLTGTMYESIGLTAATNQTPAFFRAHNWKWRLRFHIEKQAGGSMNNCMLYFGEPMLMYASAPDPDRFTPSVARWSDYHLEGKYTTLTQHPSFLSGAFQGWWEAMAKAGVSESAMQFRFSGDATNKPRLMLGYIGGFGAPGIAMGAGGNGTYDGDARIWRTAPRTIRIDGYQDTGTPVLEVPSGIIRHARTGSFPSSPQNGDRVWRSDYAIEFWWAASISRWLSTTLYELPFFTDTALPIAANFSMRAVYPGMDGNLGIYIDRIVAWTYTVAPNDTANYWACYRLVKFANGSGTPIQVGPGNDIFNTYGLTAQAFYRQIGYGAPQGQLEDGGNPTPVLELQFMKQGNPGPLYVGALMQFRLIG